MGFLHLRQPPYVVSRCLDHFVLSVVCLYDVIYWRFLFTLFFFKYQLLHISHLCLFSGQDDYDRLRPLSYQEANLVLVCFDVTNPTSYENVLIKVIIPQCINNRPAKTNKNVTARLAFQVCSSSECKWLSGGAWCVGCILLAMINSTWAWTLTLRMQGLSLLRRRYSVRKLLTEEL